MQCLAVLAMICQFIAFTESKAQQSEKPLFVIAAPSVAKSGYGQQPNAIRFAAISHQAQESPAREDGGSEDPPAAPDLSSLQDLDMDADDLSANKPPTRPVTQWNQSPMSSILPGIRPVDGKSPSDLSWQLTNRESKPIANSEKLFAWAAPDITYKPLYFEDVALERYGQTRGFFKQPIVSSLHYLKSAAFLPYFSIYDPINSCDGPLGYCRPGEKVNCSRQKHYFGNPFGRSR